MKKVLLSIIALCAGIAVQAQDIQEGYFPTGDSKNPLPYAADFISDSTMSVQDVYWWNQRTKDQLSDSIVTLRSDSFAAARNKCVKTPRRFQYSSKRSANKLIYTMDMPYGLYEPIGVGFGDVKTLDISQGNAFVGFRIKNTSTTPLLLKVGLQDLKVAADGSVTKSIINSFPKSATTLPGNFYTEEISIAFPVGATIDTVIDFNASKYVAKPYYADYPKDSCSRGGTPTKDLSFDYSKLGAVTFTIVTSRANQADGYKPYAYKGTFEISKFRVGTKQVVPLALEDESFLATGKFSVYPNPVTGDVLNLNTTAQNIRVMDMMGNVVMSLSSAKEVNVSALTSGVYTITTSKGASRFVIK